MKKLVIGLAGEGWGACAALKSLVLHFDVECLTSDLSVINELQNYNGTLINSFDQFNCKHIICAGYKSLISKELLNKYIILNIHYSLLPAYRGLHSTAWAIMNNECLLGWSLHVMNEKIDDGPIIFQKATNNDFVSSATFYMALFNEQVEKELGKQVKEYVNGRLKPTPQDSNKASWVGKRSEIHNLIDFNKDFSHCQRLLRILQPPYPPPQVLYSGTKFNVGSIKFHPSLIQADLSRILNIDDDGIWVKSLDGYFIISDLFDSNGLRVKFNNFKIGKYFNDIN